MIEGHLYFFPLSVCVLIPCAYLISFAFAIYLGHSKFEFPYVSQLSSQSPESCIYSQLINVASFLLIITIYIRYRQIAELIRNNPTCGRKYSQFNVTFLVCGLIAAFSLSMTCNFPVQRQRSFNSSRGNVRNISSKRWSSVLRNAFITLDSAIIVRKSNSTDRPQPNNNRLYFDTHHIHHRSNDRCFQISSGKQPLVAHSPKLELSLNYDCLNVDFNHLSSLVSLHINNRFSSDQNDFAEDFPRE
ncbi:unnamed protein product [Adineta ricciae]|uniref:CWH43-like N-terminal domain-containing protein n=1 Tax=Adineta ricciae TaxID=249248 RepID=A0A815GXD2_ADIRI|nr:unnamed protein product [Adineta ricciae]